MDRLRLIFPYLTLTGVVVVIVASNFGGGDRHVMEEMKTICPPCGMDVDAATALTAQVQGHTHYFCSNTCREAFLADGNAAMVAMKRDRLVDVVCQMEVNRAWGITTEYQGKTFHFCTNLCRERFLGEPETYLQTRCMVCKNAILDGGGFPATYLGTTYKLCSEAHRAAFKVDPAAYFMHSMWGIPPWLYLASIAIVLIVSFGVFDWLSRSALRIEDHDEKPQRRTPTRSASDIRGEGERLLDGAGGRGGRAVASLALPVLSLEQAIAPAQTDVFPKRADRFDLLAIGWIRWAFGSRIFRFSLQAFVAILFLLIVAAGLLGNQNPSLNIAPILTWTVWWGLLIILIMFAGKAWCYVCPWDAIAGWTEKLSFWRKNEDGLSLGLKWPRIVRNILIATILFVGLTWIELGFGVTMKPRVTAYLAIAMLLMAVVAALLFDRKSFCRYGCLVGRVSGLYALFAGVEVRHKSDGVCAGCRGKECVTGSETAYGCPTFLYPGRIETNTYCIQCMECVQACPHDNLAVNLRPWGEDLAIEGKPRTDEAYLALLMLAITGFHGMTMTPVWRQFVDGIRGAAGLDRMLGFSTGMVILMLGPIAVYAVLIGMSKRLGDPHAVMPLTYKDYFVRYAYALLPIALFYHIAHNMEHLLMEGPKVVAMISDPFGWGWNVLGTAHWAIPPLISLDRLWLLQAFLVLVGHVYSLWVAQRTSLRLFTNPKAAFRSQLPMLVGMIAFSVFSLWLLKQPMEMRTSAM